MEQLEERLKRLERSVRRWRAVTAGLVLALVVGVSMGMKIIRYLPPDLEDGIFRSIQCEELRAVDKQGTTRALIGFFGDRPAVSLYDAQGTARVLVGFAENNPAISLYDDQGTVRVFLGIYGAEPMLTLYDESRTSRASLGLASGPGLTLRDEKGSARALMMVAAEGPLMALFDEREGPRVMALGADEEDRGGSLVFTNKTGEDIVHIHADEYGNGVVGAYNRQGEGQMLTSGP